MAWFEGGGEEGGLVVKRGWRELVVAMIGLELRERRRVVAVGGGSALVLDLGRWVWFLVWVWILET